MVEGDDIAAVRELAQRLEVVVTAKSHISHCLGSAVLHRGREHAQTDAKSDGGLLHHARQLPTADHADRRVTRGHVGLRRIHVASVVEATGPPGIARRQNRSATISNTAVYGAPRLASASGNLPAKGSVGAVIGSTQITSASAGAKTTPTG